jgi:hypothetical protein
MTLKDFLVRMIPTNIVGDIAKGDIMPVLIMAVLFGLALCQLGERGRRITQLLDDLAHTVFGVVRIIMYLAPLAAFSAMAFTIGQFGFRTLWNLGQLIGSVYITSILFILVGFGLIARMFGLRMWKIIRYSKDEPLIAFSATSSNAMIPRSIAKLENMGCSQEVVGLVLPAGFSLNTDGTAIYMTLSVLFIAQATDIHLTFGQQRAMLFVMLFTSKGAAGFTGARFAHSPPRCRRPASFRWEALRCFSASTASWPRFAPSPIFSVTSSRPSSSRSGWASSMRRGRSSCSTAMSRTNGQKKAPSSRKPANAPAVRRRRGTKGRTVSRLKHGKSSGETQTTSTRGPFFLRGFGTRWWSLVDDCTMAFGDDVRAYVIAQTPDEQANLADEQGHARAAYGDDALFVIRPDNYVGLVLADAAPTPVMDDLQRITACRRPDRTEISAKSNGCQMTV